MSRYGHVVYKKPKGSILAAMLIMFFISLILFWLPVLGPLIAGIVGGKKAGGVWNGFLAVIIPSVLVGFIMFFLAGTLTGLPLVGVLAGAGALLFSLSHVGPLLMGAIIGGFLA